MRIYTIFLVNDHFPNLQADITDTARTIVIAVTRLAGSGKWSQRNFPLNHLVDIWRGSKASKIISSGWDKDSFYGKGSQHTSLEANRIIKKLILEGYLWEELVVTKDCGACAYVGAFQYDVLSNISYKIENFMFFFSS